MIDKRLKIVFFGTTDFATAGLKALIESGHEVAAVVTTPDRPQGRHLKLTPCDVKQAATGIANLPILEPDKLKDPAFLKQLKDFEADLFVVIAFRMLPEAVWAMPPLGTINIHGSLLPSYRGAAPINRAIMAGEKTTGVTAFVLDKDIDTGAVIGQKQTDIGEDETFGRLYDRLMKLGADLLVESVDSMASGAAKATPQDRLAAEHPSCAAPKIFNQDCEIDWRQDAARIHNQIRGLSPLPAAHSTLQNGSSSGLKIKITQARVADKPSSAPDKAKPGMVVVEAKRMFVACGQGWIEPTIVQPAGKKAMDTKAFLNGARLEYAKFEPADKRTDFS